MPLSLDDFANESKPSRSPCSMAEVRAALSPSDLKALDQALATPGFTHAAIARVLRRAGHQVAQGTVSRHRLGNCSCPRGDA